MDDNVLKTVDFTYSQDIGIREIEDKLKTFVDQKMEVEDKMENLMNQKMEQWREINMEDEDKMEKFVDEKIEQLQNTMEAIFLHTID
jgi:dsDNA-specific endonuclease/ATPase MutS2